MKCIHFRWISYVIEPQKEIKYLFEKFSFAERGSERHDPFSKSQRYGSFHFFGIINTYLTYIYQFKQIGKNTTNLPTVTWCMWCASLNTRYSLLIAVRENSILFESSYFSVMQWFECYNKHSLCPRHSLHCTSKELVLKLRIYSIIIFMSVWTFSLSYFYNLCHSMTV